MKRSELKRNALSFEELRAHATYDPETGTVEKITPGTRSRFGYLCHRGYIRMNICCVSLSAHRIAWALMTGKWPTRDIDHRNGIRSDNQWTNLREASNAENCRNLRNHRPGATGFKGVKVKGPSFCAYIQVNSRVLHLGVFKNTVSAALAHDRAARYFHGEFATTNFSLGLL
jgi:hypothetical protein